MLICWLICFIAVQQADLVCVTSIDLNLFLPPILLASQRMGSPLRMRTTCRSRKLLSILIERDTTRATSTLSLLLWMKRVSTSKRTSPGVCNFHLLSSQMSLIVRYRRFTGQLWMVSFPLCLWVECLNQTTTRADGYITRFGCTYVDYETQKRYPKDSGKFVSKVCWSWFMNITPSNVFLLSGSRNMSPPNRRSRRNLLPTSRRFTKWLDSSNPRPFPEVSFYRLSRWFADWCIY